MDDDIRRAFILWLKMDADSRAMLRRLLCNASPEQLHRYAQAIGMTLSLIHISPKSGAPGMNRKRRLAF